MRMLVNFLVNDRVEAILTIIIKTITTTATTAAIISAVFVCTAKYPTSQHAVNNTADIIKPNISLKIIFLLWFILKTIFKKLKAGSFDAAMCKLAPSRKTPYSGAETTENRKITVEKSPKSTENIQ